MVLHYPSSNKDQSCPCSILSRNPTPDCLDLNRKEIWILGQSRLSFIASNRYADFLRRVLVSVQLTSPQSSIGKNELPEVYIRLGQSEGRNGVIQKNVFHVVQSEEGVIPERKLDVRSRNIFHDRAAVGGPRFDICANSRGVRTEDRADVNWSFGESLTTRRGFDEGFADGVSPVIAFEGLTDDKIDGDRGYPYSIRDIVAQRRWISSI